MFNTNFSASQYGALYFTHDKYTNITDNATNSITNQSYSDLVEEVCNDLLDDSESCEAYKGIGYVVSTNFTALHASILFQAVADESIVRTALQSNDIDIKVTLHPLHFTKSEGRLKQASDAFSAWYVSCRCYQNYFYRSELLSYMVVAKIIIIFTFGTTGS